MRVTGADTCNAEHPTGAASRYALLMNAISISAGRNDAHHHSPRPRVRGCRTARKPGPHEPGRSLVGGLHQGHRLQPAARERDHLPRQLQEPDRLGHLQHSPTSRSRQSSSLTSTRAVPFTTTSPRFAPRSGAADHPALLMVDCIASLGCGRYEIDEWGVDVTVGS